MAGFGKKKFVSSTALGLHRDHRFSFMKSICVWFSNTHIYTYIVQSHHKDWEKFSSLLMYRFYSSELLAAEVMLRSSVILCDCWRKLGVPIIARRKTIIVLQEFQNFIPVCGLYTVRAVILSFRLIYGKPTLIPYARASRWSSYIFSLNAPRLIDV